MEIPSPLASCKTSSRAPNGSSIPHIVKEKIFILWRIHRQFLHKNKKEQERQRKEIQEYHILAPMFVIMQTPFSTTKGKSSSIHSETVSMFVVITKQASYHISSILMNRQTRHRYLRCIFVMTQNKLQYVIRKTYYGDHSPCHQTSSPDSAQQGCARLGIPALNNPTLSPSEVVLKLLLVDHLQTQHHNLCKPFPFAFEDSPSAISRSILHVISFLFLFIIPIDVCSILKKLTSLISQS